ncbi:hypothetical protein GCM10009827_106100 [Dactylosporangium maewongense]|uniref:Uncharacterized protein n=1 Tax=Dactylosporangium maewongense TaxID=634393 RepID=A0ABP4NSY6_9ACTN
MGWAVRGRDEGVGDGLVVEGAGGGDEQLAGVAAAAAVAAGPGAANDLALERLDVVMRAQ